MKGAHLSKASKVLESVLLKNCGEYLTSRADQYMALNLLIALPSVFTL